MLFSSRWCPLDELTASTLLINIPRIIFLHFQGDWHCHHKFCIVTKFNLQCPKYTVPNDYFKYKTNSNQKFISGPCPSSVYLLVRELLSASLWAGIINLIQFQAFPHPIIHSSKLKSSFLISTCNKSLDSHLYFRS